MSFLTEYFDEYRAKPFKKAKMCRPELRWAKFEGKWLDPKKGGAEAKVWTDEEIDAFIKKTMQSLRGRSTYFNEYCGHLDPEIATRPFVPRVHRLPLCSELEGGRAEEPPPPPPAAKLALKDTEVMNVARELYERDLDKPTLEPLPTHRRIYGYARPSQFKTGITDYQDGIGRLAYELVRDDRLPRYQAHNGGRPRWGVPPEGVRQPELDAAPFDGEIMF